MRSSWSTTRRRAPFAASYTGLAIAQNSHGQIVLYAADSGTGPTTSNDRIDMFDGGFHSIGSFTDPNVASQYPGNTVFQVENVNNKLFVTFTGFTAPFGGVVDVFDTDGHLLTPNHFAANAPGQGPLNAPWGIVQAPAHFGKFSNDLLIGNVEGAGNINAFDPVTGAFLGPLTHPDGTPIAITGLWDLAFGAGGKNNGKTDELFFTAGFTAEDPAGNGLFGMIDAKTPFIPQGRNRGPGDPAGFSGSRQPQPRRSPRRLDSSRPGLRRPAGFLSRRSPSPTAGGPIGRRRRPDGGRLRPDPVRSPRPLVLPRLVPEVVPETNVCPTLGTGRPLGDLTEGA